MSGRPRTRLNGGQRHRRGLCLTFFQLLKDQFRKLDFAPISSTTVHDVYTGPGPRRECCIAVIQDVYREQGWPDLERFRKTECLEAVRNGCTRGAVSW